MVLTKAGKRTTQTETAATPSPPGWLFRTNLSVDECREMFQVLSVEQRGHSDFFEPSGMVPLKTPRMLLGARCDRTSALYLAGWDSGTARDLNLVLAGDLSQPSSAFIAAWKMRDKSLSATGTVDDFPVSER